MHLGQDLLAILHDGQQSRQDHGVGAPVGVGQGGRIALVEPAVVERCARRSCSSAFELGEGPVDANDLEVIESSRQSPGIEPRATAQLERARTRAAHASLDNCRFDQGDAAALPYPDGRADAVVLSRLLAVVEDREQVLAEVHRVLSPGGRCFVAEPTSSFRAALPIAAMRLASWLGGGPLGSRPSITSVDRVEVLGRERFSALVRSQRWQHVSEWADSNYQYALLEKSVTVPR